MSSTQQQLGNLAIGTIGPSARIDSGAISQVTVNEVVESLRGDEFYVEIGDNFGPSSAGGTFTLVVADALTTNRFRTGIESAADHAKKLYGWLLENKDDAASRKIIPRVCIDGRLPADDYVNDSVIGGHDDEHGEDGCGAQKNLGAILRFIAERGGAVRQFLEERGVQVSEELHQMLTANSRDLSSPETGYVSSGAELRGAFVATGGERTVAQLQGSHNEVVGVVNTEAGKTLNRKKLRETFGDAYESFEIDVAPLKDATATISLTDEEAEQKFIAALYYNVATTLVLGDPSLRTVDR